MTDTMLAMRFEAWGQKALLREVPIPQHDENGILLKVTAAGMCHSDLHVMEAEPGKLSFEPPFTLGHEVAGTVISVGSNVDDKWLNNEVVVHGIWGCRDCRRCRAGRQNYCLRKDGRFGNGLGYDGGLAEYMMVPSTDYLVPAQGLDPVQAAPLTDAGLTAYHALKPHLDTFNSESKVLVIGAGGLGHFAVQFLANTPTHISVVDLKPQARELALKLGAHATFADLEHVEQTLGNLEDRFDAVFDFVANTHTMEKSTALLAPGGYNAVVGGGGGTLTVGKFIGLPQGWSVSAPFWGGKPDLANVIDLARAGKLTGHTETFALREAEEAYERLHRGEISGRAVALPHG